MPYLSGMNLSGSGNIVSSLYMGLVITRTTIPFLKVTPLILQVSVHTRETLKQILYIKLYDKNREGSGHIRGMFNFLRKRIFCYVNGGSI